MESIPQKQAKIKAFLEVLRYNWKPTAMQLLLAALGHGGPSSRRNWSIRSGIPAQHLGGVIHELQMGGAIHAEVNDEGIKILVQPIEFWRERQLCRRDVWSVAWADAARQTRLDLVTEADGLWEALSDIGPVPAEQTADVVEERRDAAAAPVQLTGAMPVNNPVNKSPPEIRVPEIGEKTSRISGENLPNFGSAMEVPCTTRAPDVKRYDVLKGTFRTYNVDSDCEQLRDRVQAFVGDRDYERYYGRPCWCWLFEDPAASQLERALRYLTAGIAEGAIRIRKSPGAALWEQFGRLQREEIATERR